VADDVTWAHFSGIIVRGVLKGADGADLTSGYTANSVRADEVVKDLLGRLLPLYDGPNAAVPTTSYAIQQLAYPDGADAAGVLDDLMALEPAYYWAAWERNGATGLHRFEWALWPTEVRYEADVRDGFSSPGSAEGLYNAVLVRYLDQRGRRRTVTRTLAVAELTAAGITRQAFRDLGDEAGDATDAVQAGDAFLAEHARAPNAGTLTVARPIRDALTGRSVAPWEIRPGSLIRVRGILPRPDALQTTTRDGVTVFRVAATEFRAQDASATLELDSYAPSTARAIADLQGERRRRR
jgi:hypothetical protein